MAEKKSGKKNTRRATAESAKKPERNAKKFSPRARDIVMLVIVAAAVLAVVSVYSPAIPWLKDGCYFLFGVLMYAAPVLVVVLFLVLLYHEKTGPVFRRLFAALLFLFALSGVLSFAIKETAGGLLGRANYALFHSWLGPTGAYVVNGLLIAISIVLAFNFTPFTYMENQRRRSNERLKERHAIREQARLQKETEELERRKQAERDLEDKKARNKALEEYNREKDEKAEKNRERFTPRYGIGNTLITDEDPEVNTTFYQPKDALLQNAALFGNYMNSGNNAGADKGDDTSFIPSISFAGQEDDETSRRRDGFGNVVGVSDPYDPEEQYTKIVVTASGSVKKTDFSGDPFRKNTSFKETAEAGQKEQALSSLRERKERAQSGVQDAAHLTNMINEEQAAPEAKKEYKAPPLNLLSRPKSSLQSRGELKEELARNKELLESTCQMFNVPITVKNISCGPTVTRYEVQPAQGIKVSRIQSLQDDIKLALAATDIRIEAPIPGKSAVGIEVPNKIKTGVALRTLLESEEYRNSESKLSFGLGMDIDGHTIISDLQKMPHLLVAGTTGSGKSVCLNTMIISILYHAKPTEVKLILIDPKVIEFSGYNGIPHLLLPVVTDVKKASMALAWAVQEMERRYEQFAKYPVRNIESYNSYIQLEQPEDEAGNPVKKMPLILIIIDEFADMMAVAPKDVEESVTRLAQKARAAGIHLVLATQSPRVDVITGIIKANIPSRIALSVSSGLESRIILDITGAETLLGHGDMLYAPAGVSKPLRVQGAFVSDAEIKDVVDYVKNEGSVRGGATANVDLNAPLGAAGGSGGNDQDDLFSEAGRIIIEKQKGSIGMLQRVLSIGFNRAARIMDQLAEAGVVGPEEGTKPRRILMNAAQFEEYLKNQ